MQRHPVDPDDAGAEAVRDYRVELLLRTWDTHKRPFGNSGWEWDLVDSLAEEGLIEDRDDCAGMTQLIETAIEEL